MSIKIDVPVQWFELWFVGVWLPNEYEWDNRPKQHPLSTVAVAVALIFHSQLGTTLLVDHHNCYRPVPKTHPATRTQGEKNTLSTIQELYYYNKTNIKKHIPNETFAKIED